MENINNEFESLIKLIEIMQEDSVINEKVIKMLQLDSYQRRSVLNNWLEQLRCINAPCELMQPLACLFDDKVAKKVLTLINKRKTLNN
jgi:hypothetical protein